MNFQKCRERNRNRQAGKKAKNQSTHSSYSPWHFPPPSRCVAKSRQPSTNSFIPFNVLWWFQFQKRRIKGAFFCRRPKQLASNKQQSFLGALGHIGNESGKRKRREKYGSGGTHRKLIDVCVCVCSEVAQSKYSCRLNRQTVAAPISF